MCRNRKANKSKFKTTKNTAPNFHGLIVHVRRNQVIKIYTVHVHVHMVVPDVISYFCSCALYMCCTFSIFHVVLVE